MFPAEADSKIHTSEFQGSAVRRPGAQRDQSHADQAGICEASAHDMLLTEHAISARHLGEGLVAVGADLGCKEGHVGEHSSP